MTCEVCGDWQKPLHRLLESFPERVFGLKAKEFLGPAEIVYGLHGFDRCTDLLVVLARDLHSALECHAEWDE